MCTVPEITDLDLSGVTTVAVDLETYDPNLKTKGSGAITGNGFVCGIAVATHKQTLYFPIKHAMTSNLNEDKTWDTLNKLIFQNENIAKVFHNAMYDVCWIRATTGLMLKGPIYDTMIAASVIDENRMKYSLDALSKDYLDDSKYKWDLKDKSLSQYGISDPMSNMHKLPYVLVKDYAEQDVSLTFRLWDLFSKKLDEIIYPPKGKSPRKIFNLETKLFPCLVDMKFRGVKIDVQKAELFGKFLERRKQKLIKIIKDKTGIEVEIWAAASIKKLLDKLKVTDYKKTPKSGMPQLPKNYLQTHKEPLLRLIAKARECEKANNAFVEGLLSFVHKGRIHADINQIRSDQGGTVTGRFSMSNPNLQQIPAKGWIGKKMRELFTPEDNCIWGSFDYSQQEPRILVHYAKLQNLNGVDEIVDAYNTGDADFHQVVADMAGIERKQAKTINLGLMYGMGKNKLMAELGLMKESAEKLIKQYHIKAPFVKRLMENVSNKANDRGKIRTLLGRACHFDLWQPIHFGVYKPLPLEQARKEYDEPLKRAFTYKALNRLIQGSAADMTKKSMVALYENGIIPHIQIHDEVDISVDSDKKAEDIIKIMESAVELKVPNKVDYDSGKNWGEIK